LLRVSWVRLLSTIEYSSSVLFVQQFIHEQKSRIRMKKDFIFHSRVFSVTAYSSRKSAFRSFSRLILHTFSLLPLFSEMKRISNLCMLTC
jgi:hypothetical protein